MDNYIIKKDKYKHINWDFRLKIESLYNNGFSVSEIASEIGCCRASVYNELKRGYYNHLNSDLTTCIKYSATIAQNDYNMKATAKGVPLKIGSDFGFVSFVEDCILNRKWSPDSICGYIKTHNLPYVRVCTRTLYNYIYRNLFLNISINNLLYGGCRLRSSSYIPRSVRNVKGNSISQRSDLINSRSCFGHWEMDTVIGTRSRGSCLLVLTERYSRYELILKIKDKTSISVVTALNSLERKYKSSFKSIFKTITCDNGCEFSDFEGIQKSIYSGNRCTLFYCHSYSAWERGSNENANRLIRRFIQKGISIKNFSKIQIKRIQDYINTLPRKILNYYSSLEVIPVSFSSFLQ